MRAGALPAGAHPVADLFFADFLACAGLASAARRQARQRLDEPRRHVVFASRSGRLTTPSAYF